MLKKKRPPAASARLAGAAKRLEALIALRRATDVQALITALISCWFKTWITSDGMVEGDDI